MKSLVDFSLLLILHFLSEFVLTHSVLLFGLLTQEAQEVDNDGVQIVQHVDRLLSLPEAAEKPPDLGLNSSKPEKVNAKMISNT